MGRGRSPLWVNRIVLTVGPPLPIYLDERHDTREVYSLGSSTRAQMAYARHPMN
jgi:hypothetical protein